VKRSSLRSILLIWVLGALLGVWLVGSIAAVATVNHITQVQYDEELFDTALSIEVFLRTENNRLAINLNQTETRALLFDLVDEQAFAVIADDGEVIVGAADVPTGPHDGAYDVPTYYDARYRGKPMRWIALTATRKSPNAGAPDLRARIVLGETLQKREMATREAVIYVVVPQLLLAGAFAALVWFGIDRVGLRPIQELHRRLEDRTVADLKPLPVGNAPLEIAALTSELNRLLERLSAALRQQAAFIGNAAHQLRTPLAALRASVDYARRRSEGSDIARNLDTVLETSDRCTRVVNQLLALAKADAAQSGKVRLQAIDLVELCQEVAGSCVDAALSRGVDIGLDAAASRIFANAEPTLLREALRNLLDNAIQYAGNGGQVAVGISSTRDRARITVVDDGPGIAVADRERIFERFQRGDAASGTGSGLGLPIARLCARAMGGDVACFDPPERRGGGFVIELAAADVSALSALGKSLERTPPYDP
jgi:two-component system sensor histidine kinase TctE